MGHTNFLRGALTATVAIAALLATSGGALAQPYVRGDCQAAGATAPTAFDDGDHQLWYRRFWTGRCDGLSWRCLPGWPNWNDAVGQIVARAPPAERTAVLGKACRLGPLVGLEWARANNVRRIDTDLLRHFADEIMSSNDVSAALDAVATEARHKLSRP